MENIKINFFSKFIYSMSNFSKYGLFIKQSVGKSILYLFILSLLLGTVSLIKPISKINTGISSFLKVFNDNVPDFTFQNGKLKVSGEMPIIIDDNSQIIIVDTTDQTPESALDQHQQGILVLSDRMIQKQIFQTKTVDFSSLAGLTFTKESVAGLIPLLKFISVAIVLFGIPIFFASKLISALLISLIGLLISSISRINLPYRDVFKISAYSLTLSIILKVLLGVSSVTVPFFWLIYYGLSIFYVWMAINKIKQEDTQTQEIFD